MKIIGQGQGHRSENGRTSPFPQWKTLISNNSLSIQHRAAKFVYSMGFSATADRMVWPLSLSLERELPGVTECTHSRVAGLRLEDNLASFDAYRLKLLKVDKFFCSENLHFATAAMKHFLLSRSFTNKYKYLWTVDISTLGVTREITSHFFRKGWSVDGTCWISGQSMHQAWIHSRAAYLGLGTTGWASSWTRSAKP